MSPWPVTLLCEVLLSHTSWIGWGRHPPHEPGLHKLLLGMKGPGRKKQNKKPLRSYSDALAKNVSVLGTMPEGALEFCFGICRHASSCCWRFHSLLDNAMRTPLARHMPVFENRAFTPHFTMATRVHARVWVYVPVCMCVHALVCSCTHVRLHVPTVPYGSAHLCGGHTTDTRRARGRRTDTQKAGKRRGKRQTDRQANK